jgi:diacylglycerol kinase (ATP)
VTAKGTILVHHPRAGDGSHSENLVAAMESNHLGPVAHHVVGQSGWRQKMRDDPGLVVVAGGDGTVADVLLAAGGTERSVGIVPLGTANNIARTVGMDTRNPERAIRQIAGGSPVPFDLPTWTAGDESGSFTESAGRGLFADHLREADRTGVATVEDARLLLLELTEAARPWPGEIEIDGLVSRGSFLAVQIMNIGAVGPNIAVTAADPGDGMADVVVIEERHRADMASRLRGTTTSVEEPVVLDLPSTRARAVRVTAPSEILTSVDDRILPDVHELAVSYRSGARAAIVVPLQERR